MRPFLSFNQPPLKKSGLFFLLAFFMLFEANAGDISISFRYRIEVAMEDMEQPVVAEVTNSENFQVLGAALNLTIRDKLSLDLAYQWSTDIGTVEPQSSVTLKAPDLWLPKAGLYTVHYELTSLNDINPTNDTLSYDLEVKPNFGLGLRFNQLNFKNPFQQEHSSTGRMDFTIAPQVAQYYLNVVIGKEDGPSAPQKWAVQNMPLPVFPDTQQISYWVDLNEIGIAEGEKLEYLKYDFSLSETLWKQPQFSTKMAYNQVFESDYDVGGDNPTDIEPVLEYIDVSPIDWNRDFKVVTWNYRGCTVPNIDLDSSVYNPRDMAGEVGDWNSCSPAAQTNSLQWLENTDSRIPKTGLSHREKLKLFNKLSGRANEDGLNTGNTIKGKLAYIDSLKLPIHVKWQGIPYDTTIASPYPKYKHSAESKNDSVGAWCTFEWLASEIEKGEDVEIKFGWYDTLNHRHGGHWVTVSGVSDVNIARGIYVKDDEEQGKEGGTRQTYLNWVTNEQGRPRLVGFKGANNRCWVESVVSESYDSTITYGINDPKVKNVKVDEGPSGWNGLKGLFEFSFPSSDVVKFLNVFAKMPGSTEEPAWIIRNLALPPFSVDQELSAWFDFSWMGFQSGDPITELDLGYEVGTDVINYHETSFTESFLRFPVSEDRMNIALNYNDYPPIDITIPPNRLSTFKLEPYKTWEYRGCTVPNIDLDSTTYNPTTVAGYAGDKNACGPASAANSMQWLENKYDEINTGTSHRDKLKELSGFMNRNNNSTVSDSNFVNGKLAFIDKYKLPIRVKMQGIYYGTDSIPSPNPLYGHYAENKNDSTTYPGWDWLVSEMKHDEDVEIGIAWYDSLGRSKGGHWVTASGVSEVGSYRGLYVKDDRKQAIPGGTRQQFTNVDTINGGKPYLPQLSSENRICILEAVVSESYDSTVTFSPVYSKEIPIINPFNVTVYENPSSRLEPVSIEFELPQPGDVQLYIYEITGRLVYSHELIYNSSGTKTVKWDGKENNGLLTGSGMYLVKVVNGKLSATVKFIRQD